MYDFAEASANPVYRFAQVKSFVILLYPTEHQGPVRVYPQVLGVFVHDYVAIIPRLFAASTPPRDRRWWKSVCVAVENKSRHPLGGTDILGLHHPTGRHCFAV